VIIIKKPLLFSIQNLVGKKQIKYIVPYCANVKQYQFSIKYQPMSSGVHFFCLELLGGAVEGLLSFPDDGLRVQYPNFTTSHRCRGAFHNIVSLCYFQILSSICCVIKLRTLPNCRLYRHPRVTHRRKKTLVGVGGYL
jgi:hypothetical protein